RVTEVGEAIERLKRAHLILELFFGCQNGARNIFVAGASAREDALLIPGVVGRRTGQSVPQITFKPPQQMFQPAWPNPDAAFQENQNVSIRRCRQTIEGGRRAARLAMR